jgi:cholesterol transport system auxiliary component
MRRRLFLLGAGAALSGCTSLVESVIPGKGEGPQLYVLTPKTTFNPDLPRIASQILVDVPLAPAEIDTNRVVLSRSPVTVDFFGNAAWPDRAPIMIQTLLVESFESTGKTIAIGRESVGLRADYILKPELRRFTAVYDAPEGPPIVTVLVNIRLVKMPERSIIAQLNADARERAKRNEMQAIVEAFDEALGKILKRIIEWTLTTIRQ